MNLDETSSIKRRLVQRTSSYFKWTYPKRVLYSKNYKYTYYNSIKVS